MQIVHCRNGHSTVSITLTSKSPLTMWLMCYGARAAILWRSSLRASHLFLSDCDRMCGLQIELKSEERCLSILGVYMPSGEQSQHCQDVYDTYFDSVEHCISQLSNKGPLLVLGDLNAHLGCRDTSLTNSRGNK